MTSFAVLQSLHLHSDVLQVEELSSRAQNVVHKYVQRAGRAGHHAAFLAATGTLPWGAVEEADFSTVESESEYASWCLTHAYTCNHVAVSVHRLQGFRCSTLALDLSTSAVATQ